MQLNIVIGVFWYLVGNFHATMSNRPICSIDTPDPWVIAANGVFYMMSTLGNHLEIWESRVLEDFHNPRKVKVWEPQGSGWGNGLWAPELHNINGTWFIYFCGERDGEGPKSRRTLILQSGSKDPMDPSGWRFMGPLKGVPENWAIDATVFFPRPNELYCCYSGWPINDYSDTEQQLFIVKLANPFEAIPDTLAVISHPKYPWERPDGGNRGVNEGPEWIDIPGFRGIVYSAHGSWTCDYKLGLLELVGDDPSDPKLWHKRKMPLLACDAPRGGPYGPGHASFLPSPNGDGTVFCVYHGTEKIDDGWGNRKARVIRLNGNDFHRDAMPCCCAYSSSAPITGFNASGDLGYHLKSMGNKLLKSLK